MGGVKTSTEMASITPHSRRAVLLTSPRTASNLFVRMLNLYNREGLTGGGYFYGKPVDFYDDNWGLGTPLHDLNDSDKQQIGNAFQTATDGFVSIINKGEANNQIAFIKEHIVNMVKPALQSQIIHGADPSTIPLPWPVHIPGYSPAVSASNPLILPDEFLHTFMPTILIRHPAVAFPSEYRAEIVARKAYNTTMRDPYSTLVLNYSYVRHLYDFYRTYFLSLDPASPWPYIIDASDLISSPQPYMHRFCTLTGIDPAPLQYTWQPLNQRQLESIGDDAVRRFLDTLNASSGIEQGKSYKQVDVQGEMQKFREGFGDLVGTKMEAWVEKSMEDYEYLLERRWIIDVRGEKKRQY